MISGDKIQAILNTGKNHVPEGALEIVRQLTGVAAKTVGKVTMHAMMTVAENTGTVSGAAMKFIGGECAAAALFPLAYALTAKEDRKTDGPKDTKVSRDAMLFAALFVAFTESSTAEGKIAMRNECHEAAATIAGGGRFADTPDTGSDRAHAAFKLIRGYEFKTSMTKS